MNNSQASHPHRTTRRPGEEAPLRSLWNFTLRNRWLTLGVPVLVVVATAVFTSMVPPTYQASTWIRIDEEQANVPVLDALMSLSEGSKIATEMEVLRRRPLAETVVDSLALQVAVTRPRGVVRSDVFDAVDVDRQAPPAEYRLEHEGNGRFVVYRDDAGEPMGSYGVGEWVRLDGAAVRLAAGAAAHDELVVRVGRWEEVVKAFRDAVSVRRPNREADVVAITFEGHDKELVREVPNTMAHLFIAQRQDIRRTEARSTVTFLNEQIDTLAVQLRDAEERLRRFRHNTSLVNLQLEAETQLTRLAELQAERDRLEAEREALAQLLAEVRASAAQERVDGPSPYRRLIAFPSLLKNFAVSELFRSLAEVENQRAELLNRRTPEDPDVQVLTSRIEELENQLRNITLTYLEGLSKQVQSLDETLDRFQQDLSLVPAKEIQFLRLKRETTVLEEIYTLLQTRRKEAEIAAAVEDPSIRVVEPAMLPMRPIKPNRKLSVFVALMLGLVLGGGAAFARENMDNTVRTREDLQDVVEDVTVLGIIPSIEEVVANGGSKRTRAARGEQAVFKERLVAGRDPRNPVSEAYRSLRTNITFARPERPPKTLVFTSPTPGDGKSTTSGNLAITLAQQGMKVLLVDADMRRGLLNEVFGVSRVPGLSNVILGRRESAEAVQRLDMGESGTLDFLPTGTLPPNPAELLGSERMHGILERWEDEYDAIILDAPPLNLVTDAAILGTFTDGVVLVARSGVTERGAIEYALDQLRAVRAPILGTVLNDVDMKKNRYYGSYGAGAHADYYGTIGEE